MAVAILNNSWIEAVNHTVAQLMTHEFESFIYDMDCRLVKLLIAERIDSNAQSSQDEDFLAGRTGFRPMVFKITLPGDPMSLGSGERVHYTMGVTLFTFREDGDFRTFLASPDGQKGDPVVLGCPLAAVQTYKHESLIDLKNDLSFYVDMEDCLIDLYPNSFSDDERIRYQPEFASTDLDTILNSPMESSDFLADEFLDRVLRPDRSIPKGTNLTTTRQDIIRKFAVLNIPYEKMPLDAIFGGEEARIIARSKVNKLK